MFFYSAVPVPPSRPPPTAHEDKQPDPHQLTPSPTPPAAATSTPASNNDDKNPDINISVGHDSTSPTDTIPPPSPFVTSTNNTTQPNLAMLTTPTAELSMTSPRSGDDSPLSTTSSAKGWKPRNSSDRPDPFASPLDDPLSLSPPDDHLPSPDHNNNNDNNCASSALGTDGPGSPASRWLVHSRNSAKKRSERDELSWSRHSVETSSSGKRASRKYDEIELGIRKPPAPLPASIYFGGCAFGAAFYVGCLRALSDMYGPEFYKDCLISGDSGGSIFAVGISLGYHPEELYKMYLRICEQTRKSHHSFYEPTKKIGASVFLAKEVRWLLADPAAYQRLSGRCWVGVTHFEDKHVWIKSYKDNEEVYTAVMGSCHIPIYCGPNKRVHQTHVVDGAYSINGHQLPHGDETLFIGISAYADITRRLTKEQLLQPPTAQQFAEMEQTGYEAMWAWNGLLKKKVGVVRRDINGIRLLWFMKCLELSWIAIIVVGLAIVIFVTLMCAHFYNGLF